MQPESTSGEYLLVKYNLTQDGKKANVMLDGMIEAKGWKDRYYVVKQRFYDSATDQYYLFALVGRHSEYVQ